MAVGVKPKQVRVTLRHSLIGRTPSQRKTVWALGLRRVGAQRVHALTPSLAGALQKVHHMVSVEEVDDGQPR